MRCGTSISSIRAIIGSDFAARCWAGHCTTSRRAAGRTRRRSTALCTRGPSRAIARFLRRSHRAICGRRWRRSFAAPAPSRDDRCLSAGRRDFRTGSIAQALAVDGRGRRLSGVVAGIDRGVVAAVENPFDLRGTEFLKLYIVLFFVALAAAILLRRWARRDMPPSTTAPPELDAYEVAYLAGGMRRAVNAAIASLINQGHLEVISSSPPRFSQPGAAPEEMHPFERADLRLLFLEIGRRVAPLGSSTRTRTVRAAARQAAFARIARVARR